jgi:hypothetical protein
MKINSIINKFKIKKFTFISAIYFFFILLISLVSAYYCYLINLRYNIGDGHNNIIFDTLQFDHAILIKNLYANWDYSQYYNGIKYSLARLPALPLFLTLLTKLSKNIYFIFILKSVIVYSVYYFICHIYCVANKKNFFFFLYF